MRYYLLGAAFAAGFAAPAAAQTTAPFTGLRVEGIAGYERPSVETSAFDGIVYGAGVGYDFEIGGAVAGVEAELSNSTGEECFSGLEQAGDTTCFRPGRDIYVGARFGTRVGSRGLIYAKAGYVNGRLELEYDDGTAAGVDDFEAGEDSGGYRLGAGAELAIGSSSFVKLEYRYSDYESGYTKHQAVAGFGFRF
jgi:outer membrane immunogenic protein